MEARIEGGGDPIHGDDNRLLLNHIVVGHLVTRVHLVELVNAEDDIVDENRTARQ